MTVADPAEIQRYAEEVLRRAEFHTALHQQRAPGWLAPVLGMARRAPPARRSGT